MREDHRFGLARKRAPLYCPDCKAKLGQIEHGKVFDKTWRLVSPPFIDGFRVWRACLCGCVILWTSRMHVGQFWERRHVLPILDMPDKRDIVLLVDDWSKDHSYSKAAKQ